jgi:hypothetical protein
MHTTVCILWLVTLTALKITILNPENHYLAYISFETMYDAEYCFFSSLLRDTPSIFQQTHSYQYRNKFLLNNVQTISLNIKSYLSRYDKCNYEFPINRIRNVFMNAWTWGCCAFCILFFVRDKFYCSILTPLPLLFSNTMLLPSVKFENNFCP